jgi:hypothetical protein
MARPALTEDQVQAKVALYCQRYDVHPGPGGLPPFPAGKRETRQHREWQTVYRALQRLRRRGAASAPPPEPHDASVATASCPVCSRPIEPDLGVPYARRSRSRSVVLHPACAQLARLGETLGPDALVGLQRFLWPGRRL